MPFLLFLSCWLLANAFLQLDFHTSFPHPCPPARSMCGIQHTAYNHLAQWRRSPGKGRPQDTKRINDVAHQKTRARNQYPSWVFHFNWIHLNELGTNDCDDCRQRAPNAATAAIPLAARAISATWPWGAVLWAIEMGHPKALASHSSIPETS